MAKQLFTKDDGNTLMIKIKGLLEHNSSIKCLYSVVGFIHVSGYFNCVYSKTIPTYT